MSDQMFYVDSGRWSPDCYDIYCNSEQHRLIIENNCLQEMPDYDED